MPANDSAEPAWLAIARREMGQHEVAGAASNPRILEYHATTTLHATSDEVPWCAAFVNWCLRQAGINGTGSAAAVSYLKWGIETDRLPGAVIVLRTPAGHHVGFYAGEDPTHIRLIGGNQSDQVKLSTYPLSTYRVMACRWPAKAK
jgi:uncharacterized protein (TIGR02594 family)